MELIEGLKRAVRTPEIRKKIIYTAFILVIYRLLANIPTPGVDVSKLSKLFTQNPFLGLLNVFSGNTFVNFAIIAIGLTPYIISATFIQLLSSVVPKLEELQQEGERGRRLVTQIKRIATVPLAIIQSISTYYLLLNSNLITNRDLLSIITIISTLVAGSMLLMWLGENLTEGGVGEGISLLIACNVLAAIPHTLIQTFQSQTFDPITVIGIVLLYILIIIGVIFINEAVRNIPINYTRRIRGNVSSGGNSSFFPVKVNTAGVMPAIFGLSMIILPLSLSKFFTNAANAQVRAIANSVSNFLNNQTNYAIIYFILVFFFTYYYAYIVFNPEKVATDLQKQGGFMPGIRPGEKTAEYLSKVLGRVTFIGALALSIVVTVPFIIQNITNINTLSVGGTGLIIVIGVILQTVSQLRSYMVTRSYDSFTR